MIENECGERNPDFGVFWLENNLVVVKKGNLVYQLLNAILPRPSSGIWEKVTNKNFSE